jgi:hypothetical protein
VLTIAIGKPVSECLDSSQPNLDVWTFKTAAYAVGKGSGSDRDTSGATSEENVPLSAIKPALWSLVCIDGLQPLEGVPISVVDRDQSVLVEIGGAAAKAPHQGAGEHGSRHRGARNWLTFE